MVWFFLIPSIPNILGNFLLPLMIGAKDLAFPRLNLISWYIFIAAGALAIYTLLVGRRRHRLDLLHAATRRVLQRQRAGRGARRLRLRLLHDRHGVNFIATVHMLRAPGMTWFRLPLFVWAIYATSIVMVLATPVLAMVLALIFAERAFGIPIFDPLRGGDPILFQHLFWFYSHPAVYIMVLPALGVDLGTHHLLRAAARFSAMTSWSMPSSGSRWSASWSGATTCSSPASRCSPTWSSRCSPSSSRCPRPSRSSTGPPRSIAARSSSTRR